MDSLITAAAHLLAAGDPLGALNHVALRDDPPALALRGIAMAQLGDLDRARSLLKRAAREFGPREAVAHARCIVAEAEIALVSRDLGWPAKPLDDAGTILKTHGDWANAAHARYLEARRLYLVGRINEAERVLDSLDSAWLPPASLAASELVNAGIAIRRVRSRAARAALARAMRAAREADIPALIAEVEEASRALDAPAARLIAQNEERLIRLEEVEGLLGSDALIIDGLRQAVREGGAMVALDGRPLLFGLVRALGEVWPQDVPRGTLLSKVFRTKHVDESHRARLRVEIGRVRAALQAVSGITATSRGYALQPLRARRVVVLTPPLEHAHADLLALLADGEAWSSSALSLALGTSQRTVQRALESLATSGKVQSFGRGRARRWLTPSVPGFPTALLLPAPPPGS